MKYYIGSLAIILMLFSIDEAFGQVNTEALRRSDRDAGFSFNSNLSFGYTGGNTTQSTIRANARLDYAKNNNRSFIVMQYANSVLEEEMYINTGFVAVRNVYRFKPAFSWELFAQQQFDEFLLIKDRKLAGTGLRSRVFHIEEDGANKFTLFLGNGFMFEREDIDADVPELNELFRSTNYVSLNWNINETFGFNLVSYFQFDVTNPSDFRNTMDTGLSIKISESFALTINMNYRYDSNPPVNIKNLDIQVLNGIQVSL